jgi:hypothetical protein
MVARRIEIVLDEEQYQKVARAAERRHVPVADIISEAIDRLPADAEARRAALEAILAAPPMPVPDDPADLRRELDEAHDRLPR